MWRTSSSYWQMQTFFEIKIQIGLCETQNLLEEDGFVKLGLH